MTSTIGVDVGGTKIAAAVVDQRGRIIEKVRKQTPARQPTVLIDAIIAAATDLRTRHDVSAVGVGAAGFVSADRGTVLFAPNLAWRDEPLRDRLEKELELPVAVENDANAAAWGEFCFGSAEDAEDLLLVAVGTGVGGGVVARGRLVRGTFGLAAEIGHLRVVPQGRACGCGQHGCWEQYASGRALVRVAREQVPDGAALLEAVGGERHRIDGPMITSLARDGDAFCIDRLAEVGRWLGEGIASLAAVLDPGVVVVGGGVAEAGDLVMNPLREAFDDTLPATDNRPHLEIRVASLGNEAALIGAADLARRES